jgi:glutathione peroxidase-family protein
MKQLFLSSVLFVFAPAMLSSIYTINIQNLSNTTISMNNYQGKKIIITVFKPSSPNMSLLRSLDSIANANSNIKLIAVPALDFGAANTASLNSLAQTLGPGSLVVKPCYVRKTAANQHALFQWLSNTNSNEHFDRDATDADYVFTVSPSGTLYAVLGDGTTIQTIKTVINQIIE